MPQTPIDLKIGLGVDYDPSGAAAAEQDLNKLNEAAGASGGGDSSAIQEQTAAQQELTDAQQEAAATASEVSAAIEEQIGLIQEQTEATTEYTDTVTAQTEAGRELEEAQAAVAQAAADAQEAQKKVAEANDAAAKASDKAKDAEEKLKRAMELAAKGQKELYKELQKLIKARREAAKAGDTETYKKLEGSIKETREAYAKLTQGIELTKVKMTQQAQLGLQTGQSLVELGKSATGGGKSFAGMAVQVLSLGTAIKTGLGPIGWAMMLLQGLQMAWDYFSDSEKKAAEAAREAKKAIEELNESLKRHAQAVVEAQAAAAKNAADATVKGVKAETDARLAEMERRGRLEDQEAQRRLEKKKKEVEDEMQILDAKHANGEISDDDYKKRKKALQKELQDEENAVRESELRRREEALAVQQEANARERAAREQELQELQQSMGTAEAQVWDASQKRQYEELEGRYRVAKETRDAKQEALDALNRQIEEEEDKWSWNQDSSQLAEWKAKRAQLEGEIAAAEGQMRRVDEEALQAMEQTDANARACARSLGVTGMALMETRAKSAQACERVTDQIAALDEQGKDLAAQSEELQQSNAAQAERRAELDRAAQIEEEANAIRERAARREKEWSEMQSMTLEERERWLRKQLESIAEGTELYDEYNKRLKAVHDAQKQEEWKEISRRSLEEQEAWLQKQLSETQEGTLLWKQYNDQLRQLNASKISKELSELGETYKVSKNYAVKETRNQAQIFKDDGDALQKRREAILRMMEGAKDDAKLQEQLGRKLKETDRQIAGLQDAMNEGAKAARKWLKELEPPKLKGKSKMAQTALKGLTRSYKAAAARAAKAAAKGDTKGLERARKSMDSYARRMERLAQHSNEAVEMHRKTTEQLDLASHATTEATRADRRSATAKKKKAAADERAAAASSQAADSAAASAQASSSQAADSADSIEGLKAQVASLTGELAKLRSAFGPLVEKTSTAVSLASETATAAQAANKRLESEIASCKKAINRLKV